MYVLYKSSLFFIYKIKKYIDVYIESINIEGYNPVNRTTKIKGVTAKNSRFEKSK